MLCSRAHLEGLFALHLSQGQSPPAHLHEVVHVHLGSPHLQARSISCSWSSSEKVFEIADSLRSFLLCEGLQSPSLDAGRWHWTPFSRALFIPG
uniref:Uncharacterized protein n=1 Tax=Ixodes ricinus TaxID=34613 RepID=A0A6B0UCJ4_IXORI